VPWRVAVAVAVFVAHVAAMGQAPVVPPRADVAASMPLPGSGLDRDKVPAASNVLSERDIAHAGVPDLLWALRASMATESDGTRGVESGVRSECAGAPIADKTDTHCM
jgi:hypothetical protein